MLVLSEIDSGRERERDKFDMDLGKIYGSQKREELSIISLSYGTDMSIGCVISPSLAA